MPFTDTADGDSYSLQVGLLCTPWLIRRVEIPGPHFSIYIGFLAVPRNVFCGTKVKVRAGDFEGLIYIENKASWGPTRRNGMPHQIRG